MRVLVFGDSIAQGFWDTEGGWVARLIRGYLTLKGLNLNTSQPDLFNLAVDGDTTDKIVYRFHAETMARQWPGEKYTCVFAVGTNDALLAGKIPQSTPGHYREQLIELIRQARVFTHKILFVGIPPCIEAQTTPVAWGDYTLTNDRIIQFESVLRSVCAEYDVEYVSLLEAFEGRGGELLSDGVHPNSAGHALIADIVQPRLKALIK